MDDDAQQAAQAVRLFRDEAVFVAKSVLLEVEWVLRRGYRQTAVAIINALEALIGLPNVTCEDAANVRRALEWQKTGMDLADALRLAIGSRATGFVTYDTDMVKVGQRLCLAISTP